MRSLSVRRNFRSFKLYATVSRQKQMIGVNSLLDDGNHMLMWDFDYVFSPHLPRALLRGVQEKHELPEIHVVRSSIHGAHAYCFARRSRAEAMHILADTPGIDKMYFNIGVVRGYWTLRIQEKGDGSFRHLYTLRSPRPAEAGYGDVAGLAKYWTKRY